MKTGSKIILAVIIVIMLFIVIQVIYTNNNPQTSENSQSTENSLNDEENVIRLSGKPIETINPAIESEQKFSLGRVKIANWDLEVLDNEEASDDGLMEFYVSKINNYDIVFIQGIVDEYEILSKKLCDMLPDYNCKISSESGRTDLKERYLIFYRKSIKILRFDDYNPDALDRWEYPPIRADFDILGYQLTVYNLHTKPGYVAQEIESLEDIIRDEGNILILGDLNADCSYYNPEKEIDFPRWEWLIKDSDDTTVSEEDCAYDRIILNEKAGRELYNFGIYKQGITEQVSDHYIVWVELEI